MKNKILTISLLLTLLAGSKAQADNGQVYISDTVLIAIGIVSVIVILVLIYLLYAINIFLQDARRSGAMKETPKLLRLMDAVPVEREHEVMLDHNYDGIQELDNRLPPWWVYMFYATIIFGFIYMWYYHMYLDGNTQQVEYDQEMAQAEIEMKLYASKVDENSVTKLTDATRIKNGETVFQKNCAACHGKLGEGGVGPNLTDAYWIHGGGVKNVFKTIKYGAPSKGMIAWQAQLSPGQIQEVASYIITLEGTNPPNGKVAQGELYKE